MCEITVVNAGSDRLNKLLFLLMGTLGSSEHKDGWGFGTSDGESWKCPLPMRFTSNAGDILRSKLPVNDGLTLGHIRKASSNIPVVTENAHPFTMEEIVFVHNGSLTPKVEKDFVLEVEVPDLDKDGAEILDKDGVVKTKKVKKSDSLVFFEEFVKNWTATILPGDKLDEVFVSVLKKTMDSFYGKFAFVFIIQGTFFVVRGKTANLFLSHFRSGVELDSPVTGWAINTSAESLNSAQILASNILQLQGEERFYYTNPDLLKEETIFKAGKLGLEELAEIKENSAPPKVYPVQNAWEPAKSGKTYGKDSRLVNLTKEVYEFMVEYSLRPTDIQYIFWLAYGISLDKSNIDVLEHFTKKVITLIHNSTNKKNKKALREALYELPVHLYRYRDLGMEYPWMLNPKDVQAKLIKSVREK